MITNSDRFHNPYEEYRSTSWADTEPAYTKGRVRGLFLKELTTKTKILVDYKILAAKLIVLFEIVRMIYKIAKLTMCYNMFINFH
jgi:hypothetical protein